MSPTNRHLRLEWCHLRRDWTAVEWNQVVLSDESRFNLSSDDNRVRVWKPSGEHLNLAFALQRYTTPSWCDAQRYVHDILQPHVLPLMAGLPGAIIQQENARQHTARMSQDCLHPIIILPWHARSLGLSPIEHNWDHLGRQVGQPPSLVELNV
ncbi:transposable element Tcb2 transposase [Trichonephila clavipes]|nr:transposable element Tcb2 transposase [Trichonephila clavipes]